SLCPRALGRRADRARDRAARERPRLYPSTAFSFEPNAQSSLPGLTRQSILFARSFLRRGWTRGSSPRVTEGLRGARRSPSPGSPEFAARVDVRSAEVGLFPPRFSWHRLDQHGAALAAADAFGGDALLDAEPLHGVDEVQHDAVAARAHGMAKPDGAAVDVEPVAVDAAGRAAKPEHLLAEPLVLAVGQATD